MATLAELVDGVYRDLADEAKAVFSQLQVEDFVRGGIADLNRVSPLDTSEDIVLVTDPVTDLVNTFAYDIGIELPYRVEERRQSDGYTWEIPPADGEPWANLNGFTFKRTGTGGTIEFPQYYLKGVDPLTRSIRVHGYAPRPLPYTSPTEVALSEAEEYSVRSYSRSAGYDLLAHDRSLFAQWIGQTNNSDVSPTQMMQMAANAKDDWDRQRSLIRTVRR